jgi:hypothetical protein
MMVRIGLMLAVLGCSPLFATPLEFEPVVMELSGTISVETHYGPPTFGERPSEDVVEKIPFLILDDPIDIVANKSSGSNIDSFCRVNRIQLNGPNAARLVNLSGRHVKLTGRLFEGHGGESYAEVSMDVMEYLN